MKIETFEARIKDEILRCFPGLDDVTGTWFTLKIEAGYKNKRISIIPEEYYAKLLSCVSNNKLSCGLNSTGDYWEEAFYLTLSNLTELHNEYQRMFKEVQR